MNLPLISHPTRNEAVRTYDEGSADGSRRSPADSTQPSCLGPCASAVRRLCDETTEYLQAAAALHMTSLESTHSFRPTSDRTRRRAVQMRKRLTPVCRRALSLHVVRAWAAGCAPTRSARWNARCRPDTTKHSPTLPSIPRKRWLVLFEDGDSVIRAQLDAIDAVHGSGCSCRPSRTDSHPSARLGKVLLVGNQMAV